MNRGELLVTFSALAILLACASAGCGSDEEPRTTCAACEVSYAGFCTTAGSQEATAFHVVGAHRDGCVVETGLTKTKSIIQCEPLALCNPESGACFPAELGDGELTYNQTVCAYAQP